MASSQNANKRRRGRLVYAPTEPDNTQNPKRELHQILNSIQHSAEWGVFVCEEFKDPRQHNLDDYWSDVVEEASGIRDLRSCLGKFSDPLDTDTISQFNHFARTLERLAKRIDRVLSQPAEDDDVHIIRVEEYPPIEAVIEID
jgi:hypothetical protein